MSYKPSNYRAAGICYDLRHKMLHGDHSEVASENRKLVGAARVIAPILRYGDFE
jgi:hypothetical protein